MDIVNLIYFLVPSPNRPTLLAWTTNQWHKLRMPRVFIASLTGATLFFLTSLGQCLSNRADWPLLFFSPTIPTRPKTTSHQRHPDAITLKMVCWDPPRCLACGATQSQDQVFCRSPQACPRSVNRNVATGTMNILEGFLGKKWTELCCFEGNPSMDNWSLKSLVYDFRYILNQNMGLYGGVEPKLGSKLDRPIVKKIAAPGLSSQIFATTFCSFVGINKNTPTNIFNTKTGYPVIPMSWSYGCHAPGFEPKATSADLRCMSGLHQRLLLRHILLRVEPSQHRLTKIDIADFVPSTGSCRDFPVSLTGARGRTLGRQFDSEAKEGGTLGGNVTLVRKSLLYIKNPGESCDLFKFMGLTVHNHKELIGS